VRITRELVTHLGVYGQLQHRTLAGRGEINDDELDEQAEAGAPAIVLKRRTSMYRPGERSAGWRKLKTRRWFDKYAEHRRARFTRLNLGATDVPDAHGPDNAPPARLGDTRSLYPRRYLGA
jgi:hypothetical protein